MNSISTTLITNWNWQQLFYFTWGAIARDNEVICCYLSPPNIFLWFFHSLGTQKLFIKNFFFLARAIMWLSDIDDWNSMNEWKCLWALFENKEKKKLKKLWEKSINSTHTQPQTPTSDAFSLSKLCDQFLRMFKIFMITWTFFRQQSFTFVKTSKIF